MNNKDNSSWNFYAYIKITRPLNCFFGSFTIIIGILNAYTKVGFFQQWENIVIVCVGPIIYILIAAASNVINDVFDLEIDKINRPDRPIPSGKIQIKSAITYSAILAALGIMISIFLTFLTPNLVLVPVFALIFALIGFFYSWKGKRLGFIGNIMVGVSFSFGIPYGAMLIVPFKLIPLHLWFFFSTAMFLLISRELVKGMEDIEGDAKYGLKTVANTKGFKIAAICSIAFSSAAMLTFTIPVFMDSWNLIFLVLLSIGNVFVLASIIFLISRSDLKENQTRASLCLKLGAYIGLIAYILAIF